MLYCLTNSQRQLVCGVTRLMKGRAQHGWRVVQLWVGRHQLGLDQGGAQGRQRRVGHATQLHIAQARQLELRVRVGLRQLGQPLPLRHADGRANRAHTHRLLGEQQFDARKTMEAIYAHGSVRASYFHAWFASNPCAVAQLFTAPELAVQT